MIFFRRKRNRYIPEIDPDEIFLDSHNSPAFDQQQFEGRIEKAITRRTIFITSVIFLCIGFVFAGKVAALQLDQGKKFALQSNQNSFDALPLFANRGNVYDRNNVELVTNTIDTLTQTPIRSYITKPGFSHILGYVSYPKKDSKGYFWQETIIGKAGVEKEFNDELEGKNGLTYTERDALGNTILENMINIPTDGTNIVLSLDSRIQARLHEAVITLADQASFEGGAGVIMNVENGEIIAMVSYPEYDSGILSLGSDRDTIASYFSDSRKVFLNRVIDGLYTPGSIVKPFVALGALTEGIIDPNKQILSTGSIAIQNPYDPELKTIFNDWRAHGWVDLRTAIAVSSNVYFYAIGGGFEDQVGLGIDKINKYIKLFALGDETGINLSGEAKGSVPSREWKEKNFPGDQWRIGDTYNTAIGQYGFQVTPIQMVRAIAALANGGTLRTPTILKDDVATSKSLSLSPENLQIIHEAMRKNVVEGTGASLAIPDISVAAKTGTAQVGISKRYLNSWSVGFFPYEKPRYAFVILMERGPKTTTTGASHAMRDLLLYMKETTPEYFTYESN